MTISSSVFSSVSTGSISTDCNLSILMLFLAKFLVLSLTNLLPYFFAGVGVTSIVLSIISGVYIFKSIIYKIFGELYLFDAEDLSECSEIGPGPIGFWFFMFRAEYLGSELGLPAPHAGLCELLPKLTWCLAEATRCWFFPSGDQRRTFDVRKWWFDD